LVDQNQAHRTKDGKIELTKSGPHGLSASGALQKADLTPQIRSNFTGSKGLEAKSINIVFTVHTQDPHGSYTMKRKHALSSLLGAVLLVLGFVGVAMASHGHHHKLHGPEMDPATLGSGLALLVGAGLMVFDRFRRK
jgi:hypothetical protein